MSGTIIHVIPKRVYNFSNVAVGQAVTVPLMEHIDVSGWREGTLIVRVHSNGIAAGTMDVKVLSEAPAPDDPGLFFQTDIAVVVASVRVANASPVPGPFATGEAMTTAAFLPNFGTHVTVVLTATQAAGGGVLLATISVDLALKDA